MDDFKVETSRKKFNKEDVSLDFKSSKECLNSYFTKLSAGFFCLCKQESS